MNKKCKQIYYSDDGYESIRLNERRDRKMTNETTTVPNIFATTKIHS